MRKTLQLLSWLALAGILLPPILFFRGDLPHDGVNTVMLLATVLWFATAPFWMNSRSQA